MQQNIFRTTRHTPRLKSPEFSPRRFLSPTNFEPVKPVMSTEPDAALIEDRPEKINSLSKVPYLHA